MHIVYNLLCYNYGTDNNPEILRSPEDEQEAADYLRQRGILPHEDQINEVLPTLNEEERKRYEANHAEIEQLRHQLIGSKPIERLSGLQQLAGKRILEEGAMPQFIGTPALHTRYNHSEAMAINAEIIGAKLNLPIEEIKQMVAACWLHDIGHSAFSHTGDAILQDNKRDPHEERSVSLIKNDPDINKALSPEDAVKVISIIREQGALGTLQSAIDTFSYLEMDGKMVGMDTFPAAYFIKDIKGFDKESGTIIVETPKLWQALLDNRAQAMKDYYYARPKKISEEATRQLLRIAVKEQYITIDDIEHSDDFTLRSKLQSLVQHDPGAAQFGGRDSDEPLLEKYKDLYTLSLGFEPEGWHIVECNSKLEAEQMLSHLPVEEIPSSFIVSPYNYTKKTLNIKDEKTGKTQTLRTSITLDPEEEKFLVCYKQLN